MTPKQYPDNPQFHPLGAGNNPNTRAMFVTIVHDPALDAEVEEHNRTAEPDKRQGKPVFVCSCWEMTPEEREHFLKHGEIWVGVMASPTWPTQPPIFVSPGDPLQIGFKHWAPPKAPVNPADN